MDYAAKALPWSPPETQFVDYLERMTQAVFFLHM